MEHGFFHTSIDLKLPQFAQPGQSSPETAVRSLVNYIYTGTLDVSPTSIKNVAILASYLDMSPVLEKIPSLAEQMGVSDFDFEDLKKKASELPEMTVDGLKKFVDAGFGTVTKMKTPMKTGDKRKPNQANKKKEPVVKKPKVEGEQQPAVTEGGATETATDGGDATVVQQTDEPTTIVQAADDDAPETDQAANNDATETTTEAPVAAGDAAAAPTPSTP